VKVKLGECVSFTNATDSKVTLNVTGGRRSYQVTLVKGASASGSAGYVPDSVGKDTIAATAPVLLGIGKVSGSGTITVAAAPSASPTNTATATAKPTGHHPTKPTAKPHGSSTPKHSQHHSPTPHATGIKLPPLPPLPTTGVTGPVPKGSNPVVAPGPTSAPPVSDSSTPVAAIIAGPLDPVENNGRGLPEAVGVLVVLGLATGWGRVLLAHPGAVDDRPRGNHRL
jgi:hypothetical protein